MAIVRKVSHLCASLIPQLVLDCGSQLFVLQMDVAMQVSGVGEDKVVLIREAQLNHKCIS